MLKRLGNAIYLIGCIISSPMALYHLTSGNEWYLGILLGVPVWFIGWIARYILNGDKTVIPNLS